MAKILIIGCGAIGSMLASNLSSNHTVIGLKRNIPVHKVVKWKYFQADISKQQELDSLPTDFDQVFFIVSPKHGNEKSYSDVYQIGLNNLVRHFDKNNCKPHWIFVSSSSVYHQSKGEWVDEQSITEPESFTSKLIREGEKTLLSQLPKSTIVRFSGIYGPDRLRLINMTRSTPVIQFHIPYYTNRIHELDCVGVLQFLFEQRLKGVLLDSIYLASDDKPVTLWEVMTWLSEIMKLNPPRKKHGDVFMSMNKRCSNKKLKSLGYDFQFPDYQTGYKQIISNLNYLS